MSSSHFAFVGHTLTLLSAINSHFRWLHFRLRHFDRKKDISLIWPAIKWWATIRIRVFWEPGFYRSPTAEWPISLEFFKKLGKSEVIPRCPASVRGLSNHAVIFRKITAWFVSVSYSYSLYSYQSVGLGTIILISLWHISSFRRDRHHRDRGGVVTILLE